MTAATIPHSGRTSEESLEDRLEKLNRAFARYAVSSCIKDDLPLSAYYMARHETIHPALISEYIVTCAAARWRARKPIFT